MKKLLCILTTLTMVGTMTACSSQKLPPSSSPESSERTSQSSTQTISKTESILSSVSSPDPSANESAEETIEKFYDYFLTNSGLFAVSNTSIDEEFKDEDMVSYAILLLQLQGKNNQDIGNPKKVVDQIIEQRFGKTVKNYNSSRSKVVEETGNIISTGWGYNDLHFILKELNDNGNGTKTGIFYSIPIYATPTEQMKQDLLVGNFKPYLTDQYAGESTPGLVELTFEEKYDADGHFYLRYRACKSIGEATAPYTLYTKK